MRKSNSIIFFIYPYAMKKIFTNVFANTRRSSDGAEHICHCKKEDHMVRNKSQRSLRLLSYAISAWLALPAYTAWADDGTQGGGQSFYC